MYSVVVQQRRNKSQKNVDEPGPLEYFQIKRGQTYTAGPGQGYGHLIGIGFSNLPKVIGHKSPHYPHMFHRAFERISWHTKSKTH